MKPPSHRLFHSALIGALIGASALTYVACHGSDVTGGPGDGGSDPNADLSADDGATQSGNDGGTQSGSDMRPSGPPEGNPALNGITAEHNKARAAAQPTPSPALPALTWSSTVAATAQAWANKCNFAHNPNSGYGENIYATSGTATPAAVVADWVSEKADYNYSANSCSAVCGHYTQVVWRNSLRLGCGVKTCPAGSGFSGPWQFWVCDYDPPGNFNGTRPY